MLAVMFVDLDDFKNINDTLGHAVGDELLKAAALRLKAVIRPKDKIARLGGDEFTIIVEAAQSRDEVVAVADRVIETLRTPFVLGDSERQHSVHASIGISLFPQDGRDGETLLKCMPTSQCMPPRTVQKEPTAFLNQARSVDW
jgi:diguanylate cyclase (GGDEF)-like protein